MLLKPIFFIRIGNNKRLYYIYIYLLGDKKK